MDCGLRIAATGDEIDRLVYELTEAEIGISDCGLEPQARP